jgi:hypothetical protein
MSRSRFFGRPDTFGPTDIQRQTWFAIDGALEPIDYSGPTFFRFPLELAERVITDYSAPGEWVLDPFCGFGTTLVAAQRLGRQAIGFEKDPDRGHFAAARVAPPSRVLVDDARQAPRHALPRCPIGVPARTGPRACARTCKGCVGRCEKAYRHVVAEKFQDLCKRPRSHAGSAESAWCGAGADATLVIRSFKLQNPPGKPERRVCQGGSVCWAHPWSGLRITTLRQGRTARRSALRLL